MGGHVAPSGPVDCFLLAFTYAALGSSGWYLLMIVDDPKIRYAPSHRYPRSNHTILSMRVMNKPHLMLVRCQIEFSPRNLKL